MCSWGRFGVLRLCVLYLYAICYVLGVSDKENVLFQCGSVDNQQCSMMAWEGLDLTVAAPGDDAIMTMNDGNLATRGYPLQGPGEFLIAFDKYITFDIIEFYQGMQDVGPWRGGSLYLLNLTQGLAPQYHTCWVFANPFSQLLPVGIISTASCRGQTANNIVFRIPSKEKIILKNIKASALKCPVGSSQNRKMCVCEEGKSMDTVPGSPTQGTCL